MSLISLVEVSKAYPNSIELAVDSVSLEILDNEFFVLLGPSGCGKTTLLKLIAGLEEASAGRIYLDQDLVNYATPGDRNVAMVFQNYALYPHMSAGENIRFPLRMRRTARREADRAVADAAEMLDLTPLLDRRVGQLSGGERQRVALARAIVRSPRAMLMDEPLSNLDASLRLQTREQLLRLHRAAPATVLYVTHDQVEAMVMGDRIGVMDRGELIQVGTPDEVYGFPVNRFVAGFLGSPPMNFISGALHEEGQEVVFRSGDLAVGLRSAIASAVGDRRHGGEWTLGVRPDSISFHPSGGTNGSWTVDFVESLGADRIVSVRSSNSSAPTIRVRVPASMRAIEGETVTIDVDPEEVHLFDGGGKNVLPAARSDSGGLPGPATEARQ